MTADERYVSEAMKCLRLYARYSSKTAAIMVAALLLSGLNHRETYLHASEFGEFAWNTDLSDAEAVRDAILVGLSDRVMYVINLISENHQTLLTAEKELDC